MEETAIHRPTIATAELDNRLECTRTWAILRLAVASMVEVVAAAVVSNTKFKSPKFLP